MNETSDSGMQKTYRVKVGLAECTVRGASEQEAVHNARAHLNKELPHMAGVIRGIMDKEFRVDLRG